MEGFQESTDEDCIQPVIGLQQLTRDAEGLNEDEEVGLGGLDQDHEEVGRLQSPPHNPTNEVNDDSFASNLKPENVISNEGIDQPSVVAAELNILPLIDVGMELQPKTHFQGDLSSLSVIANYGSSSESDSDSYSDNNRYFKPSHVVASTPSVIHSNLPVDYRTIQHSTSEDSDSDSESSDDESSSSSSGTDGPSRKAVVAAPKRVQKKVPVMMGDVTLEDLPPIEDLHISVPEHACIEIGSVSSIVDQQVIIQAKKGVPAMNLGSLLFLEKGKRTLGEIFDVFGQVTEPFYSVRFNSAEHVQQKGIEKGMIVYCAPQTEHTSYVFVQELMKAKGADPSWEYTEEAPPNCIDYSDDEEERNSLRSKRNVDRGEHSDIDTEPTPRKRVNSFERRMNERNLRKSALPLDPVAVSGGVVRGSVRGRRQLAGVRIPFVKSQFGFNHFAGGRGRAMSISFGGAPQNFGAPPIGNQRMSHPMNYGPIQPPNLTMPPPPNHVMAPQANSQPCAMMGIRPNGPPTEYRSARRQPQNIQLPMQYPNTNSQHLPNTISQPSLLRSNTTSQPPSLLRANTNRQPPPLLRANTNSQPPLLCANTNSKPLPLLHANANSQPPTMQRSNSNAQPMGYNASPPMHFPPYITPANRPLMDNADGQYPPFGVLGFMPPQTFQGGPQNNSFFSSPPPGFGSVSRFPNRMRPQAFQPMYGQLPPMFYPEFQPPQLPPGALPNSMASMFTCPPPAPPNGGV